MILPLMKVVREGMMMSIKGAPMKLMASAG